MSAAQPPAAARPPRTKQSPSDSVGATALTTSSNRLPSAPRRTPTTASLKMEDFGLLKGTPFDFGREWTKDGMTEQQKGSIEECMSEATMEKYMNDNGLRFKMNKTAKEREGLKLFGGLLPEFEVNIPILNVDLKVAAPEVESIWEAIGFTATSNNAARVAEKQKAVAKERRTPRSSATSSPTGRRSTATRSTCRAPGFIMISSRRTPTRPAAARSRRPRTGR